MLKTLVSPVISKILMILRVDHHDPHVPAQLPAPLQATDQHTQRRRVEKRDLEEVEGHGRVALGDDVVEALTAAGGRWPRRSPR